MDNLLIEDALVEIAKEYRPGLLAWVKKTTDRWAKLLEIETSINSTTLAGDEAGLRDALAAYRSFFGEMAVKFEGTETMPLFRSKHHE